jgi:hypothetical protein
MYLVDTNIVSANAPARARAPGVEAWMETHSADLYLSAVTIAEIEDGIAKVRRERATRKADPLAAWLQTLLHLYGNRVLAFDVDVARVAGALSDKARGLGLAPGLADVIVAATAQHHGLTVLTRNTKDFAAFGVAMHDPFAGLP